MRDANGTGSLPGMWGKCWWTESHRSWRRDSCNENGDLGYCIRIGLDVRKPGKEGRDADTPLLEESFLERGSGSKSIKVLYLCFVSN